MFDQPLPIGVQLLIFFCLFVLMQIVGEVVFAGIMAAGTQPELSEIDWTTPWIVLTRSLFFQLFAFIFALLIFLRITRQKFRDLIYINRFFQIKAILITLLVFIGGMVVMELLAYVSWLAEWIPNQYALANEEEINRIQQNLLIHDNWRQFFYCLVVIGIVTPIAEELVFRGLVMRKLMEASAGKVHFAVIVSSLLFAGMHFQPLKLLPMIFLGMCLGYVYHYSKDIKYSILLHFLINTSQIVFYFFWVDVPQVVTP